MDLLTERDASYWMNGDDGVPCSLKVGGYTMTGPIGFPAQAHDSNTTGAAKDLGDP